MKESDSGFCDAYFRIVGKRPIVSNNQGVLDGYEFLLLDCGFDMPAIGAAVDDDDTNEEDIPYLLSFVLWGFSKLPGIFHSLYLSNPHIESQQRLLRRGTYILLKNVEYKWNDFMNEIQLVFGNKSGTSFLLSKEEINLDEIDNRRMYKKPRKNRRKFTE